MVGLIEMALRQCYGTPVVEELEDGRVRQWHDSTLYLQAEGIRSQLSESLEQVYGDIRGGVLIGDFLKIAVISGPDIFGLYNLADLRARPEVRRGLQIDPDVEYFMDASNVWYYGVKRGRLFRYEPGTDELSDLGDFQTAFVEILQELAE